MYCPKCGKDNPDDAKVCRACGSVLSKAPVATGDQIPRTSGLAIAAFVLGILSFFSFGLTIIPAIILGIVGIVVIEKSGGRLTGRVFAVLGIVLPVLVFCAMFVILLPALRRVKEQGRMISCLGTLKQWNLIAAMYTEENDGKFWDSDPGTPGYWFPRYMDDRYKSWKTNKLWFCPSATKPIIDEHGFQAPTFNIFNAWGIFKGDRLSRDGIAGSFGINGYCLIPTGPNAATTYESGVSTENGWKTAGGRNAAQVPWWIEALRFDLWPLPTDAPVDNELAAWSGNFMGRCAINRHQGFVNAAFMDWSARKVGIKELWTLKWHKQFDTAGPHTKAGGKRPEDWPEWMRKFRDY